MNKDNISNWVRSETGIIENEIEKVTNKILKIMHNEDMNSLDKVNKYHMQIREFRSAQNKLYEMIGRVNEIKEEE